jgi:hypothetical protein
VVDDHFLAVMVDIAVMIAMLDDDGIVMVIALADDFTITIAIPVTVAFADGHADRTDANTDFFRTGRHGDTNSSHGNGYYCKTFDHRVLLSFQFVNYRNGNSC